MTLSADYLGPANRPGILSVLRFALTVALPKPEFEEQIKNVFASENVPFGNCVLGNASR